MTAATPVPTPGSRDPLAFLPRQDRHKPKCGPVRKSKATRWRMWVLIGVHVLVGIHIWHWLATGRTLTPVEPSEAMQTVEVGRINAGFLLFSCLILGTLVFGRWFCGWACHVVALQDLCAWLLARAGLKPRPLRSRLLVLAPWVVAGHMFAWPVVHAWLSEHWPLLRAWLGERKLPSPSTWELRVTTDNLWQTFPGPLMGVLTIAVVGFLIVWWLGAKGFCTHGCPYGAFFTIVDRFAPVRIKVTDACDGCGHCTSVCTSNVRVHEEVAKHKQLVDPGCMKCLDCVSVCPKDALYVGVALPKPFAVSQQRIRARADFTWPEEILLAAVALVAVQWVFRGAWFFDTVPFLMAVGLGAITAVAALLWWRLLRRPDVTFQHTVLRQQGKRTRQGRWALLLLSGWLVFTAHTFVGQRYREAVSDAVLGERLPTTAGEPARWTEPVRAAFYGTRRVGPDELLPVLQSIDRYLAWALVDDPVQAEMRGVVLRGLGRHADAERQLLDCLGDRPVLLGDPANLVLASYMMDSKRQRFTDARRLVEHVLKGSPAHPVALMLQQRLDAMK